MIKVENLVKRFGPTVAVDDVSFTVEKGEILGFLGPNGAGKSTTLKVITGYYVADSGEVTVDGEDAFRNPVAVRERIGYLPESFPLYNDMRVADYLRFVAEARGAPRSQIRSLVEEVIDLVVLRRMVKKTCGALSRGYRQRVGLAQALMHDPPILILDEPTSGLDPNQIIEVRQLIRRIGEEKVVVFSTHILQEIAAICTRVIIIKEGKLIANGAPEELCRQAGGATRVQARIRGPEEAIREKLAASTGVRNVTLSPPEDGYVRVRMEVDPDRDLGPEVYQLSRDNGWVLAEIKEVPRTIEDVYLELTAE